MDYAYLADTVTVGLHQQTKVLSFVFEELPAAVLNEVNHTIQLTVPPDTDVTGLAPSYTLSLGATGTPASGATPDFSTSQNGTVTSEDGATVKIYPVSVTVAVTIQLVTISGISQLVTVPGVGEFTVTLSGNSNFVGDVVIEKSTCLVDWSIAQTASIPQGAFAHPIVSAGSLTMVFFLVK